MKKECLDVAGCFLILNLFLEQLRLPPRTATSPPMPPGRTHPAWQEFPYIDGNYPDAICEHCELKLFKCQPSRNLLRHLSSCPNLDEAEQTKWRLFGGPPKNQRRKRRKRKKCSTTRSLKSPL
ncbi:hypothetical protein PF005_g15418 [Phytophthora fragariae]|uniref:BED-type domain-containing protein n=1 Tax=Phytophthora fragariae TaxID=53985 RepID=A0A6A3YMU5_9STRA|nr:hypothetical protein PF011_g14561 [Phytophthora fragariae]KAE9135578.1 hypothetical protein PF006_g14571 [Phytophthora fragariae]KAE9189871.1 hypothetical protein PF004_g22078 [Phytophthora fragariae]KAE9200256.1 hypothetical protein PF005_g15418 [Phytophthora fragariae]KAE9221993.1 hypothetical protein PF002_g15401 [Phytophthora fragariae]